MNPTKTKGRTAYSAIEDKAIIDYVKLHGKESGKFCSRGNALYKKMEREKVTRHSWQSMKYRYLRLLADTTTRYEFHQMIKAKSKGREIPVLTHPIRKSKLNDDFILQSWQRIEQQRHPGGSKSDDGVASSANTQSEKIIEFLKTQEGEKRLRQVMVERRFEAFMMKNDLGFKEAIKLVFCVNGKIEEAEYYMQHGKMTDGSTKWSKEEDEILIENDEEKIIELSRRRGKQGVNDRVAFLGASC